MFALNGKMTSPTEAKKGIKENETQMGFKSMDDHCLHGETTTNTMKKLNLRLV